MFFGQDRIKFRLLTTIEHPITRLTPKSGNLQNIPIPHWLSRSKNTSGRYVVAPYMRIWMHQTSGMSMSIEK